MCVTNYVNQIKNLNWERLSQNELNSLMVLSWYAAREFAESLRLALQLYPRSNSLKAMAIGELKTTNLRFDDFRERADHWEFLDHFIRKYNLISSCPSEICQSGEDYLNAISRLDSRIRAMSVVSRETELSGIFSRILLASDWSPPTLQALKYFYEQHIELDSMGGGHADLLRNFTVDERVGSFYKIRLELYRPIGKLWT